MSVADFAKTAAVMARLLEVCSDSLRAAPLTAPLRLVRTLSKFASVVSFCTCVIYHGCHVCISVQTNCMGTHNVDGAKRNTKRVVHKLRFPHTRRIAGPGDCDSVFRTTEVRGGTSTSKVPDTFRFTNCKYQP